MWIFIIILLAVALFLLYKKNNFTQIGFATADIINKKINEGMSYDNLLVYLYDIYDSKKIFPKSLYDEYKNNNVDVKYIANSLMFNHII
jgi:hypothetical protein